MRKWWKKVLLPVMVLTMLFGTTALADSGVAFIGDNNSVMVTDHLVTEIEQEPVGTTVSFNVQSSLRGLNAGEHYYTWKRTGDIPVGKWEVVYSHHTCIHSSYPGELNNRWHGVYYNVYRCGKDNQSGWFAYCADCEQEIVHMFFYATKDTVSNIKNVTVGNNKYYMSVCSYYISRIDEQCQNMEMGYPLSGHNCKKISNNMYKIKYIRNGATSNYMPYSKHYYNNATEYEGKTVTPQTKLSKNNYTLEGYAFVGWNTKPDGSGISFSDEEDFLTVQNKLNLGAKNDKANIELYAQWKKLETTLKIDANGGTYNGEPVHYITQGYMTNYDIGMPDSTPKGPTIAFDTKGGTINDLNIVNNNNKITAETTFCGTWTPKSPFKGNLYSSYQYVFSALNNDEPDVVVANYNPNPIKLPEARKTGYAFGGWFSDINCTEYIGTTGDIITFAENKTLYAGWSQLHLDSNIDLTSNNGKGAVDLKWTQNDATPKTFVVYQRKEGTTDWKKILDKDNIGDLPPATQTFNLSTGGATGQKFTAPYSGIYAITAYGAKGQDHYEATGGSGGGVSGRVYLKKGETINFTIGEIGVYGGTYDGGQGSHYGSGGGMTAVTRSDGSVIMIAGGGGGAALGKPGYAVDKNATLTSGATIGNHNAGEDGMAGGGSGATGGAKGYVQYHTHTDAAGCYKEVNIDVTKDFSGVDNYQVYQGTYPDADEDGDDQYYRQVIYRNIPTNGATKLHLEVQQSWIEQQYHNEDRNFIAINNASTGAELYKMMVLDSHTIHAEESYSSDDDEWENEFYLGPKGCNSSTAPYYVMADDGDTIDSFTVRGGLSRAEALALFDTDTSNNYILDNFASDKVNALIRAKYPNQSYLFREGQSGWNQRNYNYFIDFDIPSGVSYLTFYSHYSFTPLTHIELNNIAKATLTCPRTLVCSKTIEYSDGGKGGTNGFGSNVYSQTILNSTNNGSGSVTVQCISYGDITENVLNDVKANDEAAPNKPNIYTSSGQENNITVEWTNPGDNGTVYSHMVKSFYLSNQKEMLTSNITADRIVTGIASYYYVLDTNKNTVVTTSNGTPLNASTYKKIVQKEDGKTKYFHLAAMDKAGNMGVTATIEISQLSEVKYPVYTNNISINQLENNVYPKDGAYYVRADGETPFYLSFRSGILGTASPKYQINNTDFRLACEGNISKVSIYGNSLNPVSSAPVTYNADNVEIVTTTPDYLHTASETSFTRTNNTRDVDLTQSFVIESEHHGKQIHVSPRAAVVDNTASGKGSRVWSNEAEDLTHGITLIADGEAPVITGLDALEDYENINRDQFTEFEIDIDVSDDMSGLSSFTFKIFNNDNFKERTYEPTISADGKTASISVDIVENDILFRGDIGFIATAIDNVGNKTEITKGIGEFTLTSKLESKFYDNDGTFKQGETAILTVVTSGYADQLIVEFPEELKTEDFPIRRVFDYTDNPISGNIDEEFEDELREFGIRTERFEFMIPLQAEETQETDYTIKITAYKGGDSIQVNEKDYPDNIQTLKTEEDFTVSGSIMDDLQSVIISTH